MKVTCVACDKIIDVEEEFDYKIENKFFCSKKCKQKKVRPYNKQSKLVLECKYCGTMYKTTFYKYYEQNNIYCSHKCSTDDRNLGLMSQCMVCDKIYQRHSTRDNEKFCSRECYLAFMDKQHTKSFICEYCNESFDVKGVKHYKTYRNGDGITRKYCSKECTDKARIGRFTNENSPRWEGGKTSLQDIIRKSVDYVYCRDECFKRDGYKSIISGDTGRIVHHHLFPLSKIIVKLDINKDNWRENKHILFDVDNVVTVTEKEHKLFHSIYGKVASPDNFEEFKLNYNPNQAMEVA